MNTQAQGSLHGNAVPMPSNLRSLKLEVTGQYVHETLHKRHLFFAAGENSPSRCLSIVVAIAHYDGSGGMKLEKNGIAIIDNDNWRVVADRIGQNKSGQSGADREQLRILENLTRMDWNEFTAFCRAQERYRPGVEDIDIPDASPTEGNPGNQKKLGLSDPRLQDYREPYLRALNDLGEYALPLASRDGMLRDIMMRASQINTETGRRFLTWSLHMDFPFDRTGRLEAGGQDVDDKYNNRWNTTLKSKPEIMQEVVASAFSLYTEPSFSAFDMGEEWQCTLQMTDTPSLQLMKWRGKDMGFSTFPELRSKLLEFDRKDLNGIWATVRCLDKDLNRVNRAADVQPFLNNKRVELETEWSMDLEEELQLSYGG